MYVYVFCNISAVERLTFIQYPSNVTVIANYETERKVMLNLY